MRTHWKTVYFYAGQARRTIAIQHAAWGIKEPQPPKEGGVFGKLGKVKHVQ